MKPSSWPILFLLVALPAFADPAADAKAHSEAFARAVNAKDAKAVLALYADDARVVWPGQGEEAKGKAEIQKLVANALRTFPKDSKLVLKSQEAIPLCKGYIATVGRWEQSFTGDDGKQQTVAVRTTEIIKKQGARTLYVVDHASIGTPPPSEPAAQSGGATSHQGLRPASFRKSLP